MRFGGLWTIKKLEILEDYLNAYTTALKNKSFTLIHIDAFAGAGRIERRLDDGDAIEFLHGSTERALRVQDQSFDELIFIEKDAVRCGELENLRDKYPGERHQDRAGGRESRLERSGPELACLSGRAVPRSVRDRGRVVHT